MMLPIWACVSASSSRTTAISGAISGAITNQPKKHRKNANQVVWKMRMAGFR